MNTSNDPQVIFELTRIGAIVRISAVDAETGTEVVAQGPASAGIPALQRLAINKLKFVLRKKFPPKE